MSTTQEKILKPKLGLLELAKQLGNVSQACKVMGYSRDTFYRFKELYEKGGEEALHEISKSKPLYANRVSEDIEKAVIEIAIEFPAYGQERAANELKKRGILISASGIRSVWQRNDLENFKKRLKALEAKVAQDCIILTEEQITALEKAKEEKEANGEIETEHPGYLGSQDSYYVGNIKGIGRIYQQTFVDNYSRVAFAKLYKERTAITAADLLNDRVIPFFDEQKVSLLRILTDSGTEYCGRPENQAYQLYLGVENIDHSRTKARSPQTNGICERFHRTMQDECYNIIFRKKIYTSLAELQLDVDHWLHSYNRSRPHSGKYCYGKTPMQTFFDSMHIAYQKNIDSIKHDADFCFDFVNSSVTSFTPVTSSLNYYNQDRDGATNLFIQAKCKAPTLRKFFADQGYKGKLLNRCFLETGCLLTITKKLVDTGFQVIPKRWIVERTFAWLSNFRRMSKDYEHSPLTSKNNILFNMITSMLTKLAA